MSLQQALILGIVQGLGEFLPISSSGHLIVVPWLLGWPPHALAFDVALHVGTLVAVVAAFARDWWSLLRAGITGILRGHPIGDPDARLLWLLALGSIPGGVVGVLLDEWAETTFRSVVIVAVTMAVMGAVLWMADRRADRSATPRAFSLRDALLIGLAQALALVPGVSRSGATISMALLLGHRREASARFSFLLATPITAGAALMKVPALFHGNDGRAIIIGILAAAIAGLLSIRVLLSYVRTRDYRPFVYYRIAFAVLVALIFWWRHA